MSRLVFSGLQQNLSQAVGQGFAFRPLELSDTGPLFDATRDERFNQYLLWPRPGSFNEMSERVRRYMMGVRAGEMAALSVVDAVTGRWVSLLRCEPSLEHGGQGEFGVWTHPNDWNCGVSGRVLSMAVDVGFRSTPAREFFCAAAVVNVASLGMMRKAGMVPFADATNVRPGEGAIRFEAQTYSISRDLWEKTSAAPLTQTWDSLIGDEAPDVLVSPRQIADEALVRMRGDAAQEPMTVQRTADRLGAAAISAAVAVAKAR